MIIFQLWSAGLINQVISLELAVGLGAFLDQPVTLHHIRDPNKFGTMFSPVSFFSNYNRQDAVNGAVPRIQDLLDWDMSGWTLVDRDVSSEFPAFPKISIIDKYVSCQPGVMLNEGDFHTGYQYVYFDRHTDYNLTDTLVPYSRFFFNRTQKIDRALSNIKWKEPYVRLAEKISSSIGLFSGMHLRTTDHAISAFSISEQQFESGLVYLESLGYPILLGTDNIYNPWIQNKKSRFLILDDIIINDFRSDFQNLPFHDEVSFGLICLLILGNSQDFIGTPGSTYTAMIHRILNSKNKCKWMFFQGTPQNGINPNVELFVNTDKAFSWNRYPYQLRWWREWPESKLNF